MFLAACYRLTRAVRRVELGVETRGVWSAVGLDCDPTGAERTLVGAASSRDAEAAFLADVFRFAAGESLGDVFASWETSFAFL